MALLEIDQNNAIFYLHTPPSREAAPTFVFVNALTGSTDHWEAHVAPHLRDLGFGTLTYNFRGQTDSPFSPDLELTNDVIVDDICRLMDDLKPANPILVGLSIGGLFAAQARAKGAPADALVFLNTLRVIGPRIAWVNDALPHYVDIGGVEMYMGAMMPMIVNPDFLTKLRPNFLKGGYEPLDPAHGHANLMRNSPAANWNFDWSSLDLPVLSITGEHDRVFRDPEVIDRLFATLPEGERLDWSHAGHLLPLEVPEDLAVALADFGAKREAAL